jgi:hypothetical protein
MKIIGSKRAAELAREEFGKKAYVLRTGKTFEVGWFWGTFRRIKGEGRSWSEALRNAGVEIPAEPLGTPTMDQPEAENHKEEE